MDFTMRDAHWLLVGISAGFVIAAAIVLIVFN